MSTIYRHQESDNRVKIGRPVWNTKIYIMDPCNRLQPIGPAGELCIAGAGVARGYLNNPEVTDEKFIPAPFAGSERMYRTGDLGRWLPDGNILLIDRIDQQTKIRGFRIELGEIEAQLVQHEKIKEAVVIDREDEQNQKYLCAYIVAEPTTQSTHTASPGEVLSPGGFDAAGFRDYLSRGLPDYMIPSNFVQLEKIPLTSSGKVDRNKLPVPKIAAGDGYIAPRNDIERKLVEIWSEVLNLDKEAISINSNFFDFGGHSLTAAILTSKISKELNVMLPLVRMFKKPTIIGLSEYIQQAGKSEKRINEENLVLLQKGNSETHHIFFIHDGTGEVEGYIELCGHFNNDFNCWGIKADRLKNLTPYNTTINYMAREYIKKIKKVQPDGPYYIAGWSLGGTIAYEIVRQLESSDENIAFLAMIDTYILQKDLSGNVRKFSIDTELEFLQNLLGNKSEEIIEKLKKGVPFEEMWTKITDYFESDRNRQGIIDNLITEYNIQKLIPNVHQLSIKENFFYLNVLRSINNAWMSYKPVGTINSTIHFFEANGTSPNQVQVPQNYNSTGSIITYELSGDHFSILTEPDVFNLAQEFDKAMKFEPGPDVKPGS